MLIRDFIEKLDKGGKLLRIKKEVSTEYEIASIMKKLDGKPLLFENVKGSEYPVVANICSTKALVGLGLGMPVEKLIPSLAGAIESPKEPEPVEGDYKEIGADLTKLPILLHYKKDGGPYMSSSIVIANDKEYGLNASYHRMMVIGNDKLVLRILPRHFNEYIERGLKEFAICIGSPVQVQVTSAISCEIDKSELSIANVLDKTDLVELDGHKVPMSEFIIIAEFTGEEHEEGEPDGLEPAEPALDQRRLGPGLETAQGKASHPRPYALAPPRHHQDEKREQEELDGDPPRGGAR